MLKKYLTIKNPLCYIHFIETRFANRWQKIKIKKGNYMTIERNLWIKENLTETAPQGCTLKVGDSVEWVNDYGVKFVHKVIGFSETRYPGKVVYLNSEAYWYPHDLSTLTIIN